MRPRDHDAATKAIFVLTAVAATVTGLSAILAPDTTHASPLGLSIMLIVLCLVVAASWSLRLMGGGHSNSSHGHGHSHSHSHGQNSSPGQSGVGTGTHGTDVCWALFPMFAVALVVVLDLVTKDASVTAQIFLFFPALYGSSQLHRRGALAIAGASVLADVIVVFSQLSARVAFVNASYVAAALITSSMLLIKAGERNDALLAKLQQQAAVDPLTGLVTRRVLDSAARSALSGAASELGTVLILLDVDRFKSVNDNYGHPAGDDVLVELAALIKMRCRPTDVVSRLGGDELALLLVGTPQSTGFERAHQLLDDVASHHFVLADGQTLRLSVSVGVAHAPTHALDLRTLYSAADSALYEAKRSGRNQVAVRKAPAGSPTAEVVVDSPASAYSGPGPTPSESKVASSRKV